MIRLESIEGGKAQTHEELCGCVDKIFKKGGQLNIGLGLEYREQQTTMAQYVARMLKSGESLLFEAGTGVGKSLAYLIPGIMHAINENRPMIVSTHTKALQSQILENDLELCKKLFKSSPTLFPYENFVTSMLMGRSNYLCTTRLAHAIQTRSELFPSEQQDELERIAHWSALTKTGLKEELSPAPLGEVWEWVNADSTTCSKKNCHPRDCFFQKAKRKLHNSDVIIVNHSLLFSLLNAGSSSGESVPGILLPHDFLVIDEAHTIPDIATEHFGIHISSYGLDRALKMLYNPKKKRGLLTKVKQNKASYLVVDCIAKAEEFFNLIKQQYLQKRDEVRLHETPWIEPLLIKPLALLIEKLGSITQEIVSENDRDNLNDHRSKLQSTYKSLLDALNLEPNDHVHWIEKSGKAGQNVMIRSAPIDVAPYLRETLFNQGTSAILTSATLATQGHLDNFRMRVGAEQEQGYIENSPFDYEKHMSIKIATDAPVPSGQTQKAFREYLAKGIQKAMDYHEGGALVLFTNFSDMFSVAREIEEDLEKMRRKLLLQGSGVPRNKLVEMLKEEGNGVLFGTESFWTGIDVPGPALSQVIITKLPFENPSHPIKQAQHDALRLQGLSPFMKLTLPEAVLKFRQGIGRLIRKSDDVGIVTILDSRIVNKPYGKEFIQALPKRELEKYSLSRI